MNTKNDVIIRKFRDVIHTHKSHIKKSAAANGLYDGQLPILEYIIKNSGCTQTEIARHMNVTPASVATSIKRMENSGLINKLTDSEDLRYNRIDISDEGISRAKECRKHFNKIDEKMFENLSQSEYETFIICLDKMLNSLNTIKNND